MAGNFTYSDVGCNTAKSGIALYYTAFIIINLLLNTNAEE